MKARWSPLLLLLLCVSAGGSEEGNGSTGEDDTAQNQNMTQDLAKKLRSFGISGPNETEQFKLDSVCLTGKQDNVTSINHTVRFELFRSSYTYDFFSAKDGCILNIGRNTPLTAFTGECVYKEFDVLHMCSVFSNNVVTCCCPNVACQRIIMDMHDHDLIKPELIDDKKNQINTYLDTTSNDCLFATWRYRNRDAVAEHASPVPMWDTPAQPFQVCPSDEACGIRTFYKDMTFEFGCFRVRRSTLKSDANKVCRRFPTVQMLPLYKKYPDIFKVYTPSLHSYKKQLFNKGKLEDVDELCCFGDKCNLYIFVNFLLPLISKNPDEFKNNFNSTKIVEKPDTAPVNDNDVPLVEKKFNEIYIVKYKDYMWFRENCGPYIALFLAVYFLFIYWLSFKCDPEIQRGIQQAHREFARMQAGQMQAHQEFSE